MSKRQHVVYPLRDSYMEELGPNNNHGSSETIVLGWHVIVGTFRGILEWDLTPYKSATTITFCGHVTALTGSPAGKLAALYGISGPGETGWTESGVTWLKYDGTNTWATPGGDRHGVVADVLMPPSTGAFAIDATTMVTPHLGTRFNTIFKLIADDERAPAVKWTFASNDNATYQPLRLEIQ